MNKTRKIGVVGHGAVNVMLKIAAIEKVVEDNAKPFNMEEREPVPYVNPYPLAQVTTEKKRTKPCKRHEYVNDICRHCGRPLNQNILP